MSQWNHEVRFGLAAVGLIPTDDLLVELAPLGRGEDRMQQSGAFGVKNLNSRLQLLRSVPLGEPDQDCPDAAAAIDRLDLDALRPRLALAQGLPDQPCDGHEEACDCNRGLNPIGDQRRPHGRAAFIYPSRLSIAATMRRALSNVVCDRNPVLQRRAA